MCNANAPAHAGAAPNDNDDAAAGTAHVKTRHVRQFEVPVKVPGGGRYTIAWCEYDDLEAVATSFTSLHGLPERMIPPLTEGMERAASRKGQRRQRRRLLKKLNEEWSERWKAEECVKATPRRVRLVTVGTEVAVTGEVCGMRGQRGTVLEVLGHPRGCGVQIAVQAWVVTLNACEFDVVGVA